MLHARAGGVEQVLALVQLYAVAVAARLECRVQVGVVAARDVWQAVVQRLRVEAAREQAPQVRGRRVVDAGTGLVLEEVRLVAQLGDLHLGLDVRRLQGGRWHGGEGLRR